MGLWVNMLAFMFIAAGVFGILGFNSPLTEGVAAIIGVTTQGSQIGTLTGGGTLWMAIYVLFSIGAIVIGTVVFPNPYVLFAGVGLIFLGLVPTFVSFFTTALNGAPSGVILLIALVFGGTGIMAVLSFIKGGE